MDYLVSLVEDEFGNSREKAFNKTFLWVGPFYGKVVKHTHKGLLFEQTPGKISTFLPWQQWIPRKGFATLYREGNLSLNEFYIAKWFFRILGEQANLPFPKENPKPFVRKRYLRLEKEGE